MAGAWEIQKTCMVGILHTENVTMAWSLGLRNLMVPGPIVPVAGMPFCHARNRLCMMALESGVDYILMLDSDVIPPKDAILRLMRHNLPIVSGVYHRRSNPAGIPVMMKPVGQWVIDYPKNALIEVDVVGAGMLLIRRDVLEDLQPVMPGKHWFYWGVDMQGLLPQEKCLSEDFVFCREVNKQLGHKIMVDTSVQCLHVGYSEVTHRNMAPMECRPMT